VFLKTDSDLLFDYTRESVHRWGGHVVEVSDDLYKTGDGRIDARSQGETIKYLAFELI
jgi:hypothetical protein